MSSWSSSNCLLQSSKSTFNFSKVNFICSSESTWKSCSTSSSAISTKSANGTFYGREGTTCPASWGGLIVVILGYDRKDCSALCTRVTGNHSEMRLSHRGSQAPGSWIQRVFAQIESDGKASDSQRTILLHMARHCGKRSSQRVRLRKGESPAESRSLKKKRA